MGGNFYFLHATSSFPARQQENEWKSTARKSIPKVFCVSSQPFRNRQSFENQQELLNADDSDQRQHASDLYSVRVGISVVQFSVHPIHQLMAAASPHNPSCFRSTFLPLAPCPGRSWSNPGCLFFCALAYTAKTSIPHPLSRSSFEDEICSLDGTVRFFFTPFLASPAPELYGLCSRLWQWCLN